jgi:hypothetical protein
VTPATAASVRPKDDVFHGPLRARARSMRASRSYALVLVLIGVTFVFTAVTPDTGWSRGILVLLYGATLLLALWRSRSGPLRIRAVVIFLGVAIAVAQLLAGDRVATTAAGVLSGLFALITTIVIARGVIGQRAVNLQSVIGAICIYLLLGLLFIPIYGIVAVLGSGPLFAQRADSTPALRLYFSFVTLATVGYGDYSAASNIGRTISVIEALVGQLYLVTVVAVLVSRLTPRAREP